MKNATIPQLRECRFEIEHSVTYPNVMVGIL